MGSITNRIVAMAKAKGVDVYSNGRLRDVSPDGDWDDTYGAYGAQVTTFGAEDLATLVRAVYRGGDHLPNVTNADGTPIPSPLVAHGVRPSTITTAEIHRLAGGEYRARVLAEPDDWPGHDFGPCEGGAVSMATFGERGRDRYHHVVGSWEFGGVAVDAEGATLTAAKIRAIAEPYNIGQGSLYRAYRALTYSGARGIHTVGSFDGSQAHLSYVHHPKGTPEHWLGYSDALAWVPAEVIAAHGPEGVTYSPATGWVDADGTSAEAEVERWCADLVDGELETMDDLVRGNVYHLTVEDAVGDDGDDPDWEERDSCGGYIGDDADPTVYTSGAFYLLVDAVVSALADRAEELAAERAAAAEAAELAAAHAAWRVDTDPREYALARSILGAELATVTTDNDLDEALAERHLRMVFTASGAPSIMTIDEQ